MVLFRYILLFILVYLIVRFVARVFLALARPRHQAQSSRDPYGNARKKEGEVYIKYRPEDKEKIISKDDGEYIRYEEVDKDKS